MNFPRINRRWRYDHEPSPHEQGIPVRRRTSPARLAAGESLRPDAGLQTIPGLRPGNDEIRRLALDYVAKHGRGFGVPHYQITDRRRLNPQLSLATADAFDAMQHDPQNPAVKAAYDALIRETAAQYDHLASAGYKMEPWLQPGQPYANSKEMARDVAGKHLWFFPMVSPLDQATFGDGHGDLDPVNNPLVVKTGHTVNGHEMRANDLFRAVHEIYGHAKEGFEFGPEGEYNAWAAHAKMFSPMAFRALTTETHGQNSWVNFGRHLRRVDGSIPVKGDPDWVHPAARPYAAQKVGILPDQVIPPHPYMPESASMVEQDRQPKKLSREHADTNPGDLYGDVHGFLVCHSTRIKSDDDASLPLSETFRREFVKGAGRPPIPQKFRQPLHNKMPTEFNGMHLRSSYDKEDPLQHDLAAQMIHRPQHQDFITYLDQTARRFSGAKPTGEQHKFVHLHGIGSWENQVEPSVVTMFKEPVRPEQLIRMAADVGSWARQHAMLAFFPHPHGAEQMLHMRVPTHHPTSILPPQQIAEISRKIHNEFNKWVKPDDEGGTYPIIPGRSILPDASGGHTDVLAWIPPFEDNPQRARHAFAEIARALGTEHNLGPRYWPGQGVMLGGTDPYSSDEVKTMSDLQKRVIAHGNYLKALRNPPKAEAVRTRPFQFALGDYGYGPWSEPEQRPLPKGEFRRKLVGPIPRVLRERLAAKKAQQDAYNKQWEEMNAAHDARQAEFQAQKQTPTSPSTPETPAPQPTTPTTQAPAQTTSPTAFSPGSSVFPPGTQFSSVVGSGLVHDPDYTHSLSPHGTKNSGELRRWLTRAAPFSLKSTTQQQPKPLQPPILQPPTLPLPVAQHAPPLPVAKHAPSLPVAQHATIPVAQHAPALPVAQHAPTLNKPKPTGIQNNVVQLGGVLVHHPDADRRDYAKDTYNRVTQARQKPPQQFAFDTQQQDPYLINARREAIIQHLNGQAPLYNPPLIDLLHETAQTPEDAKNAHLFHWYQEQGLPAVMAQPEIRDTAELGTPPGSDTHLFGYMGERNRILRFGPKIAALFDAAMLRKSLPMNQQGTLTTDRYGTPRTNVQDIARRELQAVGLGGNPEQGYEVASGKYPTRVFLGAHGVDPAFNDAQHMSDARNGVVRESLRPRNGGQVLSEHGVARRLDPEFSHPIDHGYDHLHRIAKAFADSASQHFPEVSSSRPVRMGRGVPATMDELRDVIHGWLAKPRDMSFPKQAIPDMLEEMGHPGSQAWNWYQQHALPRVADTVPTKILTENPWSDTGRASDLLSAHSPAEVPRQSDFRQVAGAVGPKTVASGSHGHNLLTPTVSALIQKLRIHNPRTGWTEPPLAERLFLGEPEHADAMHKVMAAHDLNAFGLIPGAEAAGHITDAIRSTPPAPASPTWLSTPRGKILTVADMYSYSPMRPPYSYTHNASLLAPDSGGSNAVYPENYPNPRNRVQRDVHAAMTGLAASARSHLPKKFARSPAGTGAVIRGVFYPPGKMMPDLETAPAPAATPTAPVLKVQAAPKPEHPGLQTIRNRLRKKQLVF